MEKEIPIARAISVLGTSAELARMLGVSRPAVSQWLNGKTRISPVLCLPIEQATGGAVTRYEMRPDIFGPSASAA